MNKVSTSGTSGDIRYIASSCNTLYMICSFCCVDFRMKRPHSENLHDEVDTELLKERELVEGVASVLQRAVEQIVEQIR